MIVQAQIRNLVCLVPNFPETKTYVFKDLSPSTRVEAFLKEDQDQIDIVPDSSIKDPKYGYSGNALLL